MTMTIPIAVVFVAVFSTSVHGNTCKSDVCECSLNSVEILSDLIDARINATVVAMVAEFIAVINATVDERISTVNATLFALDATLGERINKRNLSRAVNAQNITISKLLSPGKHVTVYTAS